MWADEAGFLEGELVNCYRLTSVEKKILKAMTDCFSKGDSTDKKLLASLYELLMYGVMDGQAHKMLIGVIGEGYEELYSLSIKICLR